MTIPEDQIVKIVLTILAFVMTSVWGVTVYFVKKWLEKSEQDRAELARKLLKVSGVVVDLEKSVIAQLAKFDKVSTENSLEIKYKMDLLLKDLGKVEGRLDDHMQLIAQYISSMRNMSDKIEAAFRFIDAHPRATDTKITEAK